MTNVTKMAGAGFQKDCPARGLAVGDLNNDGYADVVIGLNGEAPLVLWNTASAVNHWVGLSLRGRQANPHGVGAVIRWSAGGKIRSRPVKSGGSYLSSHDPRLVLGIGSAKSADWVEIRWPGPSRKTDRIPNPSIDRYLSIEQGRGIISP